MSGKKWTEAELDILRQLYPLASREELETALPGRTYQAITLQASHIGVACVDPAARRRIAPEGKGLSSEGYVMLYLPDHARADSSGLVPEHVVVWERETGVPVPRGMIIHHLNEDKSDNDIGNLCLMTRRGHTRHHRLGKPLSEEWKQNVSKGVRAANERRRAENG